MKVGYEVLILRGSFAGCIGVVVTVLENYVEVAFPEAGISTIVHKGDVRLC